MNENETPLRPKITLAYITRILLLSVPLGVILFAGTLIPIAYIRDPNVFAPSDSVEIIVVAVGVGMATGAVLAWVIHAGVLTECIRFDRAGLLRYTVIFILLYAVTTLVFFLGWATDFSDVVSVLIYMALLTVMRYGLRWYDRRG